MEGCLTLNITFEYNRRWGLKVLNPDLPTKAWIGDWTKVCSGKTISECKNNLRDYLEKEDKGKLTIDSILSKIQIKS